MSGEAAKQPGGCRGGAPRRAILPRILGAAEVTFARLGLKGARIEDIAQCSAVPKATILYHFGTKEALYEATLQRLLDFWLDDADRWLSAAQEPLAGIEGYIRAKIAFSRARPEGSRLFAQELLSGGERIGTFLQSELRAHVSRHAAIFEAWQEQGIMKPVPARHLLFLLWSGTQAYADMQVQFEAVLERAALTDRDYEDAIETLMTLVRPLFPDPVSQARCDRMGGEMRGGKTP